MFKCLKDDQSCLDIIQDCYLKLWQNKEKVDAGKIKSWLFSCAHNHLMDFFKRESRKSDLDYSGESSSGQCFSGKYEDKDLIDKALEKLPEVQKSIILLRDLEGYNYKEIGEILSLTEAQVKVYLFRARQKLVETIQKLSIVQ